MDNILQQPEVNLDILFEGPQRQVVKTPVHTKHVSMFLLSQRGSTL